MVRVRVITDDLRRDDEGSDEEAGSMQSVSDEVGERWFRIATVHGRGYVGAVKQRGDLGLGSRGDHLSWMNAAMATREARAERRRLLVAIIWI
jgi:hypothetical protein